MTTISAYPAPQMSENVRFVGGDPLAAAAVKAAIAAGETRFGDRGRLLIRKSGTEALLRVMGEYEDETVLSEVVLSIAGAIKDA